MTNRYKPWHCETCKKYFHSLKIARHRAMHRDRKETVKITDSKGRTFIYKFGEK